MAHFAEIDENNIVVRVLVVDDKWEHMGQHYLAEVCGLGGTWIQTSYNGRIRKNFAGIGYKWLGGWDMFVPPKPEEGNWVLNRDTGQWEEVTE